MSTHRRLVAFTFLLLGPALVAPAVAEPSDRSLVVLGVRKPGAAGAAGLADMAAIERVDLDTLPLEEAGRFDVQYGQSRVYRGVPLERLIARLAPAPTLDLALLHFANGMVVPLPFRDEAAMKRLRPLVARAMRVRGREMAAGAFEPVTRKVREYVDVPIIRFAGNKLVVAEAFHPDVPERAAGSFSPWTSVDTLVGVELVNAAAYHAQFDVDAATAAGFTLYRQTCQFCHGVRRAGARFGWDFVEPMPVHTWRNSGKQLLLHVKYRRLDAPERGQMMPALKFMSEEDAAAVWSWLRAAATKSLRGYAPPK